MISERTDALERGSTTSQQHVEATNGTLSRGSFWWPASGGHRKAPSCAPRMY